MTEKLRVRSSGFGIECGLIDYKNNLTSHLKRIIADENITVLGFEAEDLKFAEYSSLKEKLVQTNLVATSRLVGSLRVIKDEAEIAFIQKASRLTDQCLDENAHRITVGVSEKEIVDRMEFWIKRKGYDLAFEPIIVAIDKNSAIPHYDPRTGNGKVKSGSVILIDFGVRYKQYVSDITRMFFVGRTTNEIVTTYNHLLDVQKKTIEQLNNDHNLKSIDAFCRSELQKYSLPDFAHGTGHGIGLEIHEPPRISPLSNDTAIDGMVFTVEPGVYVERKWGMRIEDSIMMQNDKPHILTKFSKKLTIV